MSDSDVTHNEMRSFLRALEKACRDGAEQELEWAGRIGSVLRGFGWKAHHVSAVTGAEGLEFVEERDFLLSLSRKMRYGRTTGGVQVYWKELDDSFFLAKAAAAIDTQSTTIAQLREKVERLERERDEEEVVYLAIAAVRAEQAREIERLQAESEAYDPHCACEFWPQDGDETNRKYEACKFHGDIERERDALREAVMHYGYHTNECATIGGKAAPCSCGYSALYDQCAALDTDKPEDET